MNAAHLFVGGVQPLARRSSCGSGVIARFVSVSASLHHVGHHRHPRLAVIWVRRCSNDGYGTARSRP